jgi:AbrB family looped-hinge helix DNA binding protein
MRAKKERTRPLVRVKAKFQITLPNNLRERAGIGVGDLLEADYNGQYITLKPKEQVDKEGIDARRGP